MAEIIYGWLLKIEEEHYECQYWGQERLASRVPSEGPIVSKDIIVGCVVIPNSEESERACGSWGALVLRKSTF